MRCPLHVGSRWATALGIVYKDSVNAEMSLLVGSVSVIVFSVLFGPCPGRCSASQRAELAKSSARTLVSTEIFFSMSGFAS